jgi:DNA-binding Lrp family transcriptional regulator
MTPTLVAGFALITFLLAATVTAGLPFVLRFETNRRRSRAPGSQRRRHLEGEMRGRVSPRIDRELSWPIHDVVGTETSSGATLTRLPCLAAAAEDRVSRPISQAEKSARLSFATPELLWKVLTAKRLDLLKALCGAGPTSIRQAARRVGRDVKAVHGEVTALINAAVIDRTDARADCLSVRGGARRIRAGRRVAHRHRDPGPAHAGSAVRLLTHAVHHHDVAFPDVSRAHQDPSPVPRCRQSAEAGDSRCSKRERPQPSHSSVAKSIEVNRVGIRSHRQKDDAFLGNRPETESGAIQNDGLLSTFDGHLHKPAGSTEAASPGGRAVQIEERSTIRPVLRLNATLARNLGGFTPPCWNSPDFGPAGAVRSEIDPAPVGRPLGKAVESRFGRHSDR